MDFKGVRQTLTSKSSGGNAPYNDEVRAWVITTSADTHDSPFVQGPSRTEVMYLCGLCERYPPFKSSWEFGRVGLHPPFRVPPDLLEKHLNRMHLGSGSVSVSKVGLATNSASDGPYMDTYLVRQTEGVSYPYTSHLSFLIPV